MLLKRTKIIIKMAKKKQTHFRQHNHVKIQILFGVTPLNPFEGALAALL